MEDTKDEAMTFKTVKPKHILSCIVVSLNSLHVFANEHIGLGSTYEDLIKLECPTCYKVANDIITTYESKCSGAIPDIEHVSSYDSNYAYLLALSQYAGFDSDDYRKGLSEIKCNP